MTFARDGRVPGRSSGLGILAGAVLAVAACGEAGAFGPLTPLTVIVAVTRTETPDIVIADSLPSISCGFSLQADVRGGGTAFWKDLEIEFYAGKVQQDLLGTVTVRGRDVAAAWGSDTLRGLSTLRSDWVLTSGLPFNARLIFGYGTTEVTKDDTASVSCLPPLRPGPPPTITALSLARADSLEPGDTLVVTYSAASEVGLWVTAVLLTGPCDTVQWFADWPRTSVTRTVRLPIPEDCALGVPMSVAAVALDALVQDAGASLANRPILADRTPPTIWGMLSPPSGGWLDGASRFAGDYFVGDSLWVILWARDNYGLSTVGWEVAPAGFREFRSVSGREAFPTIKQAVPPAWAVGAVQLRFFARDAAGLTSDTAVSPAGAIHIYPDLDLLARTLPVDGDINDLVIDWSQGVLYLLQSNQRRIAAVSLATLTVTGTLGLPGYPTSVDLTPGGDSLVVALPGLRALGITNLRANPPVTSLVPVAGLDTTVDQRPLVARVAANGKALVMLTGSTAAAFTLNEVDLWTGAQRRRTDAGTGGVIGGGAMERTTNRRFIILNETDALQRYDAATDAFGPPVGVTTGGNLSVDQAGEHVALGLDVYDADFHPIGRMHSVLSGEPSVALSPDGTILYQAARGVIRARVADGEVVDRLTRLHPVSPPWLEASPDGTMLVMVNGNCCSTAQVTVIYLK